MYMFAGSIVISMDAVYLVLLYSSDLFAVYRFETCWPAIAKDASGVILVSDAAQTNNKDLESWFALSQFHRD